MKRNRFIILFSYFIFLVMIGVVFVDLGSAFSFSDIPFLIAFCFYGIFMLIQQGSSKVSFVIALYFLVVMGLSYIKTGSGEITERMGEWFYLFFLAGIIHYTKEAWRNK